MFGKMHKHSPSRGNVDLFFGPLGLACDYPRVAGSQHQTACSSSSKAFAQGTQASELWTPRLIGVIFSKHCHQERNAPH
jgi:hypothetical protein